MPKFVGTFPVDLGDEGQFVLREPQLITDLARFLGDVTERVKRSGGSEAELNLLRSLDVGAVSELAPEEEARTGIALLEVGEAVLLQRLIVEWDGDDPVTPEAIHQLPDLVKLRLIAAAIAQATGQVGQGNALVQSLQEVPEPT
jgi:hypothetical protein